MKMIKIINSRAWSVRGLFTLLLLLFSLWAIAQDTEFQYDNLNRLIKETYSNGSEVTYTYDDVGNRTSLIVRAVSEFALEDLNQDGQVDHEDSDLMVSYIFAGTINSTTDLNGDGKLNVIDLMKVILRREEEP